MDDKTLFEFMQKQSETAARTEQRVIDLHGRLFGNGQPGVIQYLSSKLSDAETSASQVKVDLDTHKVAMANQRKLDKRWFAGAFAVLGAEGTVVAWYIHYVMGHLQNWVKILK